MARRLNIPDEQREGFVTLRELPVTALERIAADLPDVLLQVDELDTIVKGAAVERVAAVSRAIFTLAAFVLDHPSSPETALSDVSTALEEAWKPEEFAEWSKRSPLLLKLLKRPGLLTLTKTIRLQYDHTNILTDTSVITDVRPVFNADGTSAVAAIICHTLRLSFQSEGRYHHLTLALDTADLERLRDDAKRALTKADTMTSYLKQPTSLPTRVAGGGDDGP